MSFPETNLSWDDPSSTPLEDIRRLADELEDLPPPPPIKFLVVYENPTDYPGKFVVRRWRVFLGGAYTDAEPLLVCETLEETSKLLRPGAINVAVDGFEDRAIREVWL